MDYNIHLVLLIILFIFIIQIKTCETFTIGSKLCIDDSDITCDNYKPFYNISEGIMDIEKNNDTKFTQYRDQLRGDLTSKPYHVLLSNELLISDILTGPVS